MGPTHPPTERVAVALLALALLARGAVAHAQDAGVPDAALPDAALPAVPPALEVGSADVAAFVAPVVDPSGHALDAFFDALARTARGDGVTRVAHFGDSNIAFDGITQTLRTDFQRRFGDAGHGFVLLAHGNLPYGHRGVDVRTRGSWHIEPLVRGRLRDGAYGLGGVLQLPGPGATASVSTSAARLGGVGQSASRLVLFYRARPHGGIVDVTATGDGGEAVRLHVDTSADVPRDESAVLDVPDGAHRFVVRHADGRELRLYGVALERDVSGVVWDSLGMVGARARRVLALDAEHARAVVAQRAPQLVVVAFGANEASDRWPGDSASDEELGEVLARLRAGAPDASCLVVGPADQAPPGARARTYPSLPRIVESQRRAAGAAGCAFFDTLAAMGGTGSIVRWARHGLALGDHRHLSPRGYERVAAMLEAALFTGLRDRLAAPR